MVSIAYAMGQGGAAEGAQGGFGAFIPLILMFVIFYFLLIRPQQKKQKEHQEMIDNVQIHDKVVTNGGIIGTIVNIKKDKNIVVLRVDDSSNTKIEFQKNSISGVLNEKKKEKTSN